MHQRSEIAARRSAAGGVNGALLSRARASACSVSDRIPSPKMREKLEEVEMHREVSMCVPHKRGVGLAPWTDIGPSHRPTTGPPASLFCTVPMFGTRLGLGYPTLQIVTGHPARMAEASPGSSILNGGAGLTAEARERGGSQARIVDEAVVGGVVYIDIDALSSQQSASDQGSAAAARATNQLAPYVPGARFGSLHRGISVETWNAVTGQRLIGHRAHMLAQASPGPTIVGGAEERERDVHASQQSASDQGSAAAARATNDGVDSQQVLSTILGGLVVLSVTGTSKGDYPEFIKLGLFVGVLFLVVLTFLALMMKNGKAAMRVVAGMSIAALTISAVYDVSEKVYIKCIIGTLGAMATVATAVIKWR